MTDFPSSPLTGDEYTENGITYIFDGTKWKPSATKYFYSGSAITPVSGISTIDLNTGNFFELDISEQTEVQISNPPPVGKAQKFYIKFGVDSGYQDPANNTLLSVSYDNLSYNIDSFGDDIFFKSDGSSMYIRTAINIISQYNLSTPWDISTSVLAHTETFSETSSFFDYFIRKDEGGRIFTISSGSILTYSMADWDISTKIYSFASYNVTSEDSQPRCLFFKPDGTKVYVLGNTTGRIYQYSVSSAWFVRFDTVTYDGISALVNDQDTSFTDMYFSQDGSKVFILGETTNTIYQYSLTTPWDLTEVNYDSISYSISNQDDNPTSIFFRDDTNDLYVHGTQNTSVYKYSTFTNIPTVTWPASFQWETGSPPTLPELGQTDLIEVTTSDGGTTYYAKLAEDNIS